MKKLLATLVFGCMVFTQAAYGQMVCDKGDGYLTDGDLTWIVDNILPSSGGKTVAQVKADLTSQASAVQAVGFSSVTALLGGVSSGMNSAQPVGGGLAMNSKALRSVDGLAAVAAGGYCGWELWASPFADWSRANERIGAWAGYKLDTYGFNIGAAKLFDTGKAGLFGGYSHSAAKARGADLSFDVNHWTLGGYADFNVNNFAVRAILGHMWDRYHSYRFESLLGDEAFGAKHGGSVWFTSFKVGYDFAMGSGIKVTPSIGWDYTRARASAFTAETLLSGESYEFGRSVAYSSRVPLLVKIAYDATPGTFYVEGGYVREFSRKTPGVWMHYENSSGEFTGFMAGRSKSNDQGVIGVGFDGECGRWMYGFKYNYSFDTRGWDNHYLGAKVGIKF